ncbi:MAG TPA: dynamin family protein [Chloroflexota bacterium]|nr:dynamin family protein [Chloroflexota bacterium]
MNNLPPSPIGALREPALAGASLAARESEALLTLLDRAAMGEPLALARVLATAAAFRMRLLEAGGEEAAGWWDAMVEAERPLHGSLIDALRAAPPPTQERVLTYLRELAATGSPAFIPLREPLEQTDLVVAVAGDFKRGKSTLLNALIGRRILPTRVAPATAAPCVLRYASAIEIRVHYRDARPVESIAEEDLERYACIPRPGEEEEVAFRPEIDHLEIGLPWAFPQDVALLDLPGLNEEGGRAEMARLAVAGADAVLVVLAATQLLAEDELQFIDSLWAEGQRTLVFAVNHLDQLDVYDLALVHRRAATLLAPYGGIMDHTIFLVSARLAVNAICEGESVPPDSGLPPLRTRLEAMLGVERGAIWRVGRARQALAALEEHDREAGDAVLEQQDVARQAAADLDAAAAELAAAERAQGDREAEAAHALAMGRERLADHDRRFEERWDALVADLQEQSRREPLPWLWQDAREWLRAETIRAIRDVYPEVTPRPEGYLRIGIPPGLRLGREPLRAFYREEARREWDRFTAEARQQGREELETAVQVADDAAARLREQRAATIAPLDARRAELVVTLAREEGRTRTLVEEALTASEALRAGLEAFVL